jgi:hypothetical protein
MQVAAMTAVSASVVGVRCGCDWWCTKGLPSLGDDVRVYTTRSGI